jgi:hypothetical protein
MEFRVKLANCSQAMAYAMNATLNLLIGFYYPALSGGIWSDDI